MKRVGIRELRDNFSHYMGKVKEGEVIYVTDRNVPIAQIVPLKGRLDPAITEMLTKGEAAWNGGKPAGCPSPPPLKGAQTLAEMVAEDRR